MKISYRWLRDFVETELGPEALADRLVNAGTEVASVRPVVEGLAGVVVGEIQAIERDLGPTAAGHHNRLCRVAVPGRVFSVVCGAPNVAPGLRTAFAPPGARLPGGRSIAEAVIRGVRSEGMCCSEKELGLGDDAAGILALPADAPLGADLVAHLGLDDTVLEIEITPNRPDLLSVVGVAREIAALTGAPLRVPDVTVREGAEAATARAGVEILDPDLCPRYAARLITDLTVAPSPAWMAQRLRAVGLRPISNLVDVTNYVLWERGHPLHAFDHARLHGGRIVVRRARPGERLTTLDGRERVLTPDMLMICDPARAVAVGGIMGGAESEVTAATRTVLLESACFHPGSIRRTARTLGLHTDAAYRFERGADIEGLRPALDRAAQLMADLGGGAVARGVIDVYPAPRVPPRLVLRPERVERLIGAAPPRDETTRILRSLGFGVDDARPHLDVTVPSFRGDVAAEDDLVEEVARVWGYDRIPETVGGGGRGVVARPATLEMTRAVGRALIGAGLSEVITYAFVDPDRLAALGLDSGRPGDGRGLIALQNPLSRERSVMRPSLLPGLLETLGVNASRQVPDVRVFEIARTFAPHEEADRDCPAHEELWVGVALTGLRQARGWQASRDRADVFDAKGGVALVLAAAGRGAFEVEPLASGPGPFEEGRGAHVLVEGRRIGWFGEVSARAREVFGLSGPVVAAEVSLSALVERPTPVPRFRRLPRFPAVMRDLALVVPAHVTADDVERAIGAMEPPWLVRAQLFDVYSGSQVGAGRRSLAWSLTFQSPDRTLTDAEVNEVHARIVAGLTERFAAEVRGV